MRKWVFAAMAALSIFPAAPVMAGEEFQPDQALIAQVEAKFAPIMNTSMKDIGGHDVKALAPLDQYARFYAGEIDKGEKVVVGAIRYRRYPPGVHVVTMKELPMASGGGCSVIMLWYHVGSGKIESVCNFPM
jgi:hypothetical protein